MLLALGTFSEAPRPGRSPLEPGAQLCVCETGVSSASDTVCSVTSHQCNYMLHGRLFQDRGSFYLVCLRSLGSVGECVCWRLTGVVEDEASLYSHLPSFVPGVLSVSSACPGWSGAPESVSCPGMPFFIQFMGQGALGIPEVWFEAGEGEWRRVKLTSRLHPAVSQSAVQAGQSWWPACYSAGGRWTGGAQDVLI